MSKEEKKKLLDKYPRKEGFLAPELNRVMVSVMSESSVRRDSYATRYQETVGSALMALGAAVSTLLDEPESIDKLAFLENLNDAAKLMADTHFQINQSRRALILPGVSKPLKELLDKAKSDSELFGKNLTEKIKHRVCQARQSTGPTKITIQRKATGLQQQGDTPETTETVEEVTQSIDLPSQSQGPRFNSNESLSKAFTRQKVPVEALEIVLASLSTATVKQYKSALSHWWNFCSTEGIDFFNPDERSLLLFLSKKFEEGASYGSLNCFRSAISLISADKIGDRPIIRRFLRGAYKLKPSLPKYSGTWEVDIVLDYLAKLQPLESLSIGDLTNKTVMLLALSTAHRAQTLSCIEVDKIKRSPRGMEITITKLIKTSGPGKSQPVLVIPEFKERPELCVASAIRVYLEKTAKYRGTEKSLFLATKKPHKKVGAQTISRWIKRVMKESGVDTEVFSAHSTRHASTSVAFTKGVSLDIIRATAGWSERSQVFARYYNRPVQARATVFASSVFSIS
ncbi:uncharacterized protein [Venturia canescens]|uniref:uncharacterized protein n=1 Tax=Venturia canescens TaxID=32260 RepID=UPI001C9CF09A|nr:uncharacterized protein LOC122411397 [Venturia canescens]